jgi:predicted MFS family arabinose efflux permease
MNEGASACAGGIAGACDKLYPPGFMWPGVAVLAVILLVLIFLSRKNIIKAQFKIIFAGWFILVLIFSGIVYSKTESAGDRTQQAAELCQVALSRSCEY